MCSDAHCISSHIVRRRAAFRAQNSSGIHRYGPRCALLNANPRGQAGRKEEAREAHLICPSGGYRYGGAAARWHAGSLRQPPGGEPRGSNFEIDTNANLKVDDPAPSIDWAGVSETRKADVASGSGDDSFGQGTKEDTAVPTVVSGSIPPNKSDLLNFGVYLETNANGARFLNLFWHRVQEPNGTTNMDFEFNQSSTISANGKTPARTSGDLLIQYDLSQGGTNPVLFLSKWIAVGDPGKTAADCEASNSLPCWSKKLNLTAQGDATGSINTSAIPATASDGLGAISPRTFGEAQIDLAALTGGAAKCVPFASAYLKSRSSDSFVSELKDFIAPVSLRDFPNQCGQVIIRKQTDPNGATATFGYTKSFSTDPSSANTFQLQDDGVKDFGQSVLPGTGYTVTEDVIPAGWDFVSVDCSASKNVTPSINGRTLTFAIDSPEDVLDCTYNNRTRGAIEITKTAKHADTSGNTSPNLVAGFTIKNSSGTVATVNTDASGKACVGNLLFGNYTVEESSVPNGYKGDSAVKSVEVNNTANCSDDPDGEEVSFTNTPLTNITVSVDSRVDGGTKSTIDCGAGVVPTGQGGDGSTTRNNLEPGTYTCTVVVDP